MPSLLLVGITICQCKDLSSVAATVVTAIAATICNIRAASDVSRTSNRLELVDQILVLQELTVLEFRILELVAQFLNGVLREHSSGRITISADSVDNFASVAIILSLDRINVPVSFAAALLRRETVFLNLIPKAVEALKHGRIHGIEAITQTVLNAEHGSLKVVEIEFLTHI